MLEKIFNRIMLGAKTPEGKIITILLTLSLALMTWNATSISAAFAADNTENSALVDTDGAVDGEDVAVTQEGEGEQTPAPEGEEPIVSDGDSDDVASGGKDADRPSDDQGAPTDEGADDSSDGKDAGKTEETTDENAEGNTNEQPTETVDYPAQTLVESADGVTVSVAAPEGALPEGAKLRLTGSSASAGAVQSVVEGTVESIAAVSISFADKDGNAIEPLGDVTVTVSGARVLEGQMLYVVRLTNGTERVAESNSGSAAFAARAPASYALVVATPPAKKGEATDDSTAKRNTKRGDSKAAEQITVTFDPTTDPTEPQAPVTIQVNAGEAIGDQLLDVPEVPGYITKWVIQGTTTEVTSETVVTEPFTAVVDKEKIFYTVTFVQKDGTEESRTTSIDDGFAVNDLPEVTPETNKIGKWVYPGTTNEFTVGTVISEDLTVNAYYEQNIFTVKFMVDGSQYEEMTTATGTTIVLPSDPIKEGADFKGWFTEPNGQGTRYTAESTVSEDLVLYAYFTNQVRVRFLVRDDQGRIIDSKSQYFIDLTTGDQITTLPDDPFMPGKVFDYWKNEENDDRVEVGYIVTDSFDAVAVFNTIETYRLTVNYFYKDGAGDSVPVGTQVYDLTATDLPYTVTAPGSTVAHEVAGEPTYFPKNPTFTVTSEGYEGTPWTESQDSETGKTVWKLTVDDEFVPADAHYLVGHYLRDLTGGGYTRIETVEKDGVKGSVVTPEINSYAYAQFDHRDENVTITETTDPKQELKVYYGRRDFTLSYNVDGGTYIPAQTKPYGTTITLPATATRDGYTFGGWYKDAACTQSAGTSIELEDNITLYAKWNAAQSDYKIVYMIENANDDGYSYLATVTKQAATDSSITMTAQSAGAQGTRPSDLDTTNFTFKDSTTETVKADGTTVVTVRYSRNVYTITWNGSGYELNNQGRANWRTNRGHASITAKFGADISAQWTETFNVPHPNWCWNFSSTNNDEKFTSLDIMPSGNKTVYHWYYSTTKTQILNYWLENYDGSRSTTHNGRTYGLFKSVTVHYNYLYNTDYPDYAGYTKGGWVRSDGAGSLTASTPNGSMTADFYYNALQYPLTFYNYNGTLISTQQVTLNADISGYLASNVPQAPMEGAIWKGWFTDPEHAPGTEYSGGTKMPAGLVLYGDFEFPTRTVTFDSRGGSDVPSQTDEYGFYAQKPDNPTREHYDFQGWFPQPEGDIAPYDFNRPVEEDITLYAHWTQETISYTVHYYKQGTTEEVLPDKTVSDPTFRENQEITESAPSVAGYVAHESSQTIHLSFDEAANTITFYYGEIPDEITYTVNYVLRDHPEIKVAAPKEVTVSGSTTNVMEMAVEPNRAYMETQTSDSDILDQHYRPVSTTKEMQLGLGNNVLTFEYVPITSSKITVNYLDMDGNEIEDTDVGFYEKGDTFTLQNKAPDGFVYHHAYLDGTTTAPEPTYQITGNEGDLVINVYYQKKLIVLANNKAKTYDGEALYSSFENPSDYTVTGLRHGDRLTSLGFDGSQTDAGTSATTPKNAVISVAAGASAAEQYYNVIYVPGSLTVKPVSVYISISADQWSTHSGSTGGPNYYTGQEFNVGFTNPMKPQFNDNPSVSAYINITSGQRGLFKAKYGDAIWNALYGTNGALISEKDAGYYRVTGAEQRATVAGVTVGGQAMMSDPNYSITLYARDSILLIEPLPLVITTPSDEKVYDGDPLMKSDGATLNHSYWTENIGGIWTTAPTAEPGSVTLGTGDAITFEVNGSQTPVGSSDNTYDIKWGETNPSNYKITSTLGTLTVTSVELKVTVNDSTEKYNGANQSGSGFAGTVTGTGETITTDDYTVEGLGKGDVLTIAYTPATGKDVGTYTGSFAAEYTIVDAEGNDVTGNYETKTFTPGKLDITKRTVTLTSASASKTYDGTALTDGGVTVGGDGFVSGQGATYTVTGTQTYVGGEEGNNTFTYTLNQGTNASNYTITTVFGTLTVTANTTPITILSSSGSKTYDGTELHKAEYTVKYGETVIQANPDGTFTLPTGDKLTITDTSKVKNVADTAEGNNTYTYELQHADQYTTIAPSYGTLTITKASLAIAVKDQIYTYNSAPQGENNKTYLDSSKVMVEGLQGSDKLTSITLNGQEINAGVYDGKIVPSAAEIGGATGNYDISYTNGKLTIEKKALTITANPQTYIYNGEKQGPGDMAYDDPAEIAEVVTVDGLEGDDAITAIVLDGQGEEVGTYDLVPYNAAIGIEGALNSNYEITYVNGTLTIASKKVIITAKDASKAYDGTALTQPGFTVEGMEEGDTHVFTVVMTDDSTITAVGTQSNVIAIVDGVKVTTGVDTVVGNYIVVTADGTLVITDKNVPGDLVVTKTETSKAASEDGKYTLGESVTWDVSVTNIYNEARTVTVTDKLTGDKWTEELAAETTKTFATAPYKVTEADVKAGEITNTATVAFGSKEWSAGNSVKTKESEPDVFTITYKLNGGTYDGSAADIVEQHKAGEVIAIHAAPVREGYEFTHWEGSSYQPGDRYEVTGDHVFTAQWKKTGPAPAPNKQKMLPKTGDELPGQVLEVTSALSLAMVLIAGLRLRRRERD